MSLAGICWLHENEKGENVKETEMLDGGQFL